MEEVRLTISPTVGYMKFPSIPLYIIPYLSLCYLSHIMLCISNGCKSHSHTTQSQWSILKMLMFRSICWEEKTEEFFQKHCQWQLKKIPDWSPESAFCPFLWAACTSGQCPLAMTNCGALVQPATLLRPPAQPRPSLVNSKLESLAQPNPVLAQAQAQAQAQPSPCPIPYLRWTPASAPLSPSLCHLITWTYIIHKTKEQMVTILLPLFDIQSRCHFSTKKHG